MTSISFVSFLPKLTLIKQINNGNKKVKDLYSAHITCLKGLREVEFRSVNHEYDYRQNWTTQSPIIN